MSNHFGYHVLYNMHMYFPKETETNREQKEIHGEIVLRVQKDNIILLKIDQFGFNGDN